MKKKEQKEEGKSGFPEDGYTANFIETQENLYNPGYKNYYDFEEKAKKPFVLHLFNVIFYFIFGGLFLMVTYHYLFSFFKDNNFAGLVVLGVIGIGGNILMFLILIKEIKALKKSKNGDR